MSLGNLKHSEQAVELDSTAATLDVLTQQQSKMEEVMQLLNIRFLYCKVMNICQHWYEYSIFTHMYPAQSDEIILVLYEKKFLLIFSVTIIWPTTLLRYDDVGHCKCISGLQKKHDIIFSLKEEELGVRCQLKH